MSLFFDVSIFKQSVFLDASKRLCHVDDRIVCFDYGTCKIGCAVSDAQKQIAFPKDTIIGQWNNIDSAFSMIQQICENYHAHIIIFGFPKKMDNTLNENCNKILQISKKFNQNDYQILLFDERFSTKASTSIFRYANKNYYDKNNKNKIKNTPKYDDAMSACVILNDVLNIINN